MTAGSLLRWWCSFIVELQTVDYDGEPVGCAHADCWPAGWQETIAALPLAITLVVWVALSLLATRIRPAVRLLLPPALFLVLSTALACAWRPCIVPVLLGPRPI